MSFPTFHLRQVKSWADLPSQILEVASLRFSTRTALGWTDVDATVNALLPQKPQAPRSLHLLEFRQLAALPWKVNDESPDQAASGPFFSIVFQQECALMLRAPPLR